MAQKKTRAEWINSFKVIHGDRYVYEKAVFKNSVTKIEIVCKSHGSFWQSPNKHSAGRNCPECSKIAKARKHKINTDKFIMRAKQAHGDKYSYDAVHCASSKDRVKIWCPDHGYFVQSAYLHYSGLGCSKCGDVKAARGRVKYDTQSFVDFCQVLHVNKYDYSQSEYQGANNFVDIICPDHGLFQQRAAAHYNGSGCPECALLSNRYIGGFGDKLQYWQEKGDSFSDSFLYLVRLNFENMAILKYGITTKSVHVRACSARNASKASSMEVVKYWEAPLCLAYSVEQLVKERYKEYWHTPKQRFSGWTECLENISEQEVIDYIEELV